MTNGERAGRVVTAAEIRSMAFRATRYRDGYDREHVDGVMRRVEAALRAREAGRPFGHIITAEEVRDTRFATTKFREGYEQDHVDDLLDQVILTLLPDAAQGPQTVGSIDPGPVRPGPSWRPSTPLVVTATAAAFILGVLLFYAVD